MAATGDTVYAVIDYPDGDVGTTPESGFLFDDPSQRRD